MGSRLSAPSACTRIVAHDLHLTPPPIVHPPVRNDHPRTPSDLEPPHAIPLKACRWTKTKSQRALFDDGTGCSLVQIGAKDIANYVKFLSDLGLGVNLCLI